MIPSALLLTDVVMEVVDGKTVTTRRTTTRVISTVCMPVFWFMIQGGDMSVAQAWQFSSFVPLWPTWLRLSCFYITNSYYYILVSTIYIIDVSQKSENLPKICLIKCLKGHKSLGSLCSVVKTLIVSGVRGTNRQWVLLSCCGQLKNHTGFPVSRTHQRESNEDKLLEWRGHGFC